MSNGDTRWTPIPKGHIEVAAFGLNRNYGEVFTDIQDEWLSYYRLALQKGNSKQTVLSPSRIGGVDGTTALSMSNETRKNYRLIGAVRIMPGYVYAETRLTKKADGANGRWGNPDLHSDRVPTNANFTTIHCYMKLAPVEVEEPPVVEAEEPPVVEAEEPPVVEVEEPLELFSSENLPVFEPPGADVFFPFTNPATSTDTGHLPPPASPTAPMYPGPPPLDVPFDAPLPTPDAQAGDLPPPLAPPTDKRCATPRPHGNPPRQAPARIAIHCNFEYANPNL